MKKSFLHRAIAFLLSIVVLLGLVGCGSSSKMHCSACGAENDNTAKFCVECGTSLSVSTICQSCGQENDIDSKFCSSCGNTLSSQSTNQSTQNSETSDKTEGTNGDQTTIEPDPAESVWLKVKQAAINGYSYTVAKYDSNGYLVAETNYLSSSNTVQYTSKYVNDEYGNRLSHSFSTPGKTINETYRYEYDENGKMLKKYYHYITTGPSSEGEEEYTYTYDANGRLSESVNINNNNKSIYQYDDAGRLSVQKNYYGNGIAISEIKFFYLENGLLAKKETTRFGNENNYTTITVENYLYSTNGISTKTVISTDDSKRIQTITCTYLCDKYGNIIQDSDYTYEYMSLYEYRKQGLCDDSGKITCGCAEAGYSTCQGHICTTCEGDGKLICKSCEGSGKDSAGEFNGSDACRTCTGTGWWMCDNCLGSGKWFSK